MSFQTYDEEHVLLRILLLSCDRLVGDPSPLTLTPHSLLILMRKTLYMILGNSVDLTRLARQRISIQHEKKNSYARQGTFGVGRW